MDLLQVYLLVITTREGKRKRKEKEKRRVFLFPYLVLMTKRLPWVPDSSKKENFLSWESLVPRVPKDRLVASPGFQKLFQCSDIAQVPFE